ncbi:MULTISPECIES: thiocillin family RiPP [Lysinibacillus]|uniref:thiocillin family RiPP n=1 Tax=Lysinibacillus TaxID=400634 RepID=UPI0001DA5B52|nr:MULTISPECIES: thiocillin family RiPP [Lysinibacillus]EFI66961.1 hypothetical protein BFZC1_19220 [Lysinibacillus fusiformis ZC1]EKU44193.1 hypothetical protein C518_0831 [Lysinibacillus fusiformis ZB2]MBX8945195.1 thiocillin family RiPP [Lysinibacillus sp. K60]MED4701189.1 thiocillin family RiPP [Lysinibacillus capsici]UNT55992.1 thiocillin family RiPP [Lysinibacillus capsici]
MNDNQNFNRNLKDTLYIEEQMDVSEFAGFTTTSSLATGGSFASVGSCASSVSTGSCISSAGD